MRFLFLIVFLVSAGCTTMDHSRVISPSKSLYHRANRYYEDKDFSEAIDLYKQFLEARPRSDLAVPAQLNMGMSYYYVGLYKDAYTTLKEISIKDEQVKKYIDNILKICEKEAGDEIKAEAQVQATATASSSSGEQIHIEILDAYLDDFGSLELKGKTNRGLAVWVDGKSIPLDSNNMFTASVNWRKGRPVPIEAKEASGASQTLDYYPDGESPEEPEGLAVSNASSNSIEVEWDENRENDIKGYRLFYRLKGGNTREVPNIIKDTKYDIVGLEGFVEGANRTFQFYLRAVDKMGNESDDSDILETDLPS